MGAWGAGSFDNDAALDFVAEIESIDDIRGAFRASNEEGHVVITDEIDSDLSCQIVVAAECVAAMRGHRSKDMPHELAEKVHALGKPSTELFELARGNVSCVMSGSELLELWAESEHGVEFNLAMTDLVERLNQPAKRRSKPPKPKRQNNPSPCMFCDQPMGMEQWHDFQITLQQDKFSHHQSGGFAHIACLNAALHPRHMIQNWQLTGEVYEEIIGEPHPDPDLRD